MMSKAEEEALAFPAGKLNIYFGSQTGTAENFAKILANEGRKKGLLLSLSTLLPSPFS